MADNYFVTAVLVSHDGAEWLPEVIASIFSQSRKVDRIIAVDNGSKDGSEKLLSSAGITLIKSDRESGFGDAIDLALDSSKPVSGDKEELIWLLHDDCALNRYALGKLIESLKDEPQVAMVGPKLRSWKDRKKLIEVGVSIAVNGARWTDLEFDELDQGQRDQPREVLAVSTAGALIRRKIFEDLGGLDPNLAIFRDDIDFGWRVRLAGFSVKTAPSALAYHAEAAANEIRSVDVEEAFLHRPHLLDRKNAAFVLLANASWWLLPWVAIQLLGAAAIRSIGYLLAKLPGYALDEIGAVGLVIINPNDLRRARKSRKAKRLLSPRIIREFIPHRGSQIRLAWDRSIQAISKKFKFGNHEEYRQSVFTEISDSDEPYDETLAINAKRSRLEIFKNRPLLIGLALLILIDIFASRTRFGSLSGGALPIAHGGATELLNKFGQSWHPVAMGSAASTPTWVEIVGIASGVTLGNISFFFATLFFLAPIFAFISMYRAIKRSGLSVTYASVGGAIYALSPVVWNCVNQGRIGTLVVLFLVPSFLSLKPLSISEQSSWRRIYALALFAGVIGAFSPILLIIWSLIAIFQLAIDFVQRLPELRKQKFFNFLATANLGVEKRRLAVGLVPLLLNIPWSGSLILHPTQILLEAGLPLNGGSPYQLLFFNPGGESGLPIWVFSPMLLFLLVVLFSQKYFKDGVIAALLLALALVISPLHIVGHGSVAKFWAGPLIVVAQCLIIPRVLNIFAQLLPNLRASHLGLGHIVTGGLFLLTTISMILTSAWNISAGGNSLVKSGSPNVIPAFIASLSDTPAKPKTLVLLKTSDSTNYFITRGSDLELGDPDVTVGTPPEIESAVDQMITGTGIGSSKLLGAYGIQYVYMRNPVDPNLVRTIDGLGGFIRSSATSAGIVWRVAGALPRVSIKDSFGNVKIIKATDIGAADVITNPGRITLAEKYDGNWKLLVNGKQVSVQRSAIGEPVFDVTDTGALYLEHDGTKRRAMVSLHIIVFLTILVLALPAGRRKREINK